CPGLLRGCTPMAALKDRRAHHTGMSVDVPTANCLRPQGRLASVKFDVSVNRRGLRRDVGPVRSGLSRWMHSPLAKTPNCGLLTVYQQLARQQRAGLARLGWDLSPVLVKG